MNDGEGGPPAGAARAKTGVIVALDAPNADEAEELVFKLGGEAEWVKIGLELFCAEGPQVVRRFAAGGGPQPGATADAARVTPERAGTARVMPERAGTARVMPERAGTARVMLDLKLHDIPNTVARAIQRASHLGAELVTVHAAGGKAMLEAAAEAAKACPPPRPRVLAVTLLTSMTEDDLSDIGCPGRPAEVALQRARLAEAAGCDGVVTSPHEASAIREQAREGFIIVTPGVRPAGTAAQDQRRVSTPRGAKDAGADFIVVGRPITRAEDPRAALRAIAAELED